MRLVLNELSVINLSESETLSLYNSFFNACIESGKLNFRTASIISVNRFSEFYFNENYRFERWLSIQTKEFRTLILSMIPRLPLLLDYPYYSYKGQNSKGFGFAFENDLLAISFNSDLEWKNTQISITLEYIEESTDSYKSEDVLVYHAYDEYSIKQLQHFVARSIFLDNQKNLNCIESGVDLWQRKSVMFPSLRFCSDTEAQIRNLSGNPLNHLMHRLFEMNNYFTSWVTGDFDINGFGGKPRLESETRLRTFQRQLTIRCSDGQYRLFSYHCNYSLSGHRLHFFPDSMGRICWIGYIGKKIV